MRPQPHDEVAALWNSLPQHARARLEELIRRDLPDTEGAEIVELDIGPLDEPEAVEDTMCIIVLSCGAAYAVTYLSRPPGGTLH